MFIINNEIDSNLFIEHNSTLCGIYDGIYYTSIPLSCCIQQPGASLVSQYINGYKYRTGVLAQIDESCINEIHEKAYELDESQLSDQLDDTCEEFPTLQSIMSAFIELGYVKNCIGPRFAKPTKENIQYFIRDYGGCIIECKATTTTYNARNYDISLTGEVLSEDMSKGFIAYAYDSSYVYLQNSLGIKTGSMGFHRMPWTTLLELCIKCALFYIDNSIVTQ